MVRYGILMNVQQCIGCKTCMVACKDVQGIPVNDFNGQSNTANGREYYRIWPVDLEQGTFPYVVRNENIYRCMQCKNPACVPACPNKALVQRADGIVVVNTALCTGQQKCIAACPYGAIYYRADIKKSDKCDLCATLPGFIDSGNAPACVQSCLGNAMVFGDLDDPLSTISIEMSKSTTYTQFPQYNLNPSIYYTYHQAVMHATVVDSTGKVVFGATATATDLVSGLTYTQTSDSQGRFAIRKLNVGSSYSLTVALTGYTSYSNAKIQLTNEYTDLGSLTI